MKYADQLGIFVSVGGHMFSSVGSLARDYPNAFVQCPIRAK